jgi:hypothetical protein
LRPKYSSSDWIRKDAVDWVQKFSSADFVKFRVLATLRNVLRMSIFISDKENPGALMDASRPADSGTYTIYKLNKKYLLI